ncbi:hypothetical protein BC937DRAFT_88252, partial [Endogone sp. FLAS-F59071]
KPEPVFVHDATIDTLSILFGKTQDKPELQREIVSRHLPKFNASLMALSANVELLPTIFPALSQSITAFPNTFRPVADNCKSLCLTFLDGTHGNEPALVQSAAQCLAALTHIGGKANSARLWSGTVNQLIGSVHTTLDRLLDSVEEETKPMDSYQSLEMAPVSPDYVVAFPILFNRVGALNEAICSMLSTSTLLPVQLPINHIINLLCRIYNVYEGSLMAQHKDRNEYLCLLSGLPMLHLTANKVFASLLHCANDHLIRYLRLLSNILLRLLSQNHDRRAVRSSTYHVVAICLEKFGIGMIDIMCTPLLNALLEDIRIPERKAAVIAANLGASSGKKSSKKRKAEITNSDALSASTNFVESPALELQLAAFEVLRLLLAAGGHSISLLHRYSIDNLLVSRLLLLSQSMPSSDDQYHLLIKLKLYECLLASVLAPSETQANVLTYALQLFSAGQNEQSGQIRSLCSQALTICDLILHSRMPPIQRSATLPVPPVYVSGLTMVDDEGGIDGEIMDEDDDRPTLVAKDAHKPQVEMGRFQQSPVVEPVVPSVPGQLSLAVSIAVSGSVHVQQGTPVSVVTEGKIENQEHSGPTKWTDVGESGSTGKSAVIPSANASNIMKKSEPYTDTRKRAMPKDFAESSSVQTRETREAASDSENEDLDEMPEIVMEGPDSDVEDDDL